MKKSLFLVKNQTRFRTKCIGNLRAKFNMADFEGPNLRSLFIPLKATQKLSQN